MALSAVWITVDAIKGKRSLGLVCKWQCDWRWEEGQKCVYEQRGTMSPSYSCLPIPYHLPAHLVQWVPAVLLNSRKFHKEYER